MKATQTLGEFEEIVLLITARLGEDAYAVPVTTEIEKQTGRRVGFNTVHTTLQRLEVKGFLNSQMAGATDERGGRRKRFFRITPLGFRVLGDVREVRERLWSGLPLKTSALTKK